MPKSANHNGMADPGCQTATVPADGKIHRAGTICENLRPSDFQPKHTKDKQTEYGAVSRCQNASVPAEGKTHRAVTIDGKFKKLNFKKNVQKRKSQRYGRSGLPNCDGPSEPQNPLCQYDLRKFSPKRFSTKTYKR